MKVELKERPGKAEIALLPAFVGLPLDRIEVLRDEGQLQAALAQIQEEVFIGFDTESKPTFTAGAVQDGPHVIQLALRDRAYIVQIDADPPLTFLLDILESDKIVKAGFGLKHDRALLYRKLGIRLTGYVELTHTLRQLRYRDALGLKAAVAIVLGRRLHKPRSVTTSNWAAANLSPGQLLYAANDAYASLAIFRAMGCPWPEADTSPQRSEAVSEGTSQS